ncbi:HAD-IA family hydrolase [Demequina sp.]|uniref:HAD-IA family hydrolase n=1 Tax=Demequina sp. TaxID=2050685 RepID=UPI0025BEA252|nr:HAD-IA family hydrolase [Demequina sp.]
MALEALVFDVDGTLAETERDGHRVAFNRAFSKVGLPWFWGAELYDAMLPIAGGKERMHHYANTYQPLTASDPNFAQLVTRTHALKTEFYLERVATGGIPLRPGVAALIKEARERGLRLAIATTTAPENAAALLTSTLGDDAMAWFEVVGAGDIVPHKKPSPDIYQWVLDRLSIGPAQALACEDSAIGLAAATAADIPTIVTPSNHARGHHFDGAAAVMDSLEGTTVDNLIQIHARATAGMDAIH